MLIDDREATLDATLRQWCEESIDAAPAAALPSLDAMREADSVAHQAFMLSLRPLSTQKSDRVRRAHRAALHATQAWPYAEAFRWRDGEQPRPFNVIGLIGRIALDVMRRDVHEPRVNIRAEWIRGSGFSTATSMLRWSRDRALGRLSRATAHVGPPTARGSAPGRLRPASARLDPFWLEADQMLPPGVRGGAGNDGASRTWAARSHRNLDEATRQLQVAAAHADAAARAPRHRAVELRRLARSIARKAVPTLHAVAYPRPTMRPWPVYFTIATPVVAALLQGAYAACENAMSSGVPGRRLAGRLGTAADCTELAGLVLGGIAEPHAGIVLSDNLYGEWSAR